VLSEIGKRTEETLLKHLQAFGSGDVDAVMADSDEDAVLIMPDGTLHGTAEIRSGFESLLVDLPAGLGALSAPALARVCCHGPMTR
jgi:ketosteroid isomerase-like protein